MGMNGVARMRDPDTGSQHLGQHTGGPEVLIEFRRLGNCVKVTAVDTVTLLEVSIMGPSGCGRETLTRNAVRKLDYMLARRAGPGGGRT
jgi:hypothetical protein